MRTPRRILVGLLLIAAIALTACGSSGIDSDQPIKSAGVLRVGTEGTYPPYSFHDPSQGGQLAGYDVDVARAVADKLGVEVEFVETQWDSIFAALEADRFDIVANEVTVTEERKAKYDLSTPYSIAEGVVVTRSDDNSVTTLADLKGKRTAQNPTSNWADVARKAGAQVESVDAFAQAISVLNDGRVDAVVNDNITVLAYLAEHPDARIKIAVRTGERSDQAFAARKDSGYLPELNKALEELRADGTLTRISEKYLDVDLSKEPPRSTWQLIGDNLWPLAKAAVAVTIPLTLISFAIGLVLALVVALARLSSNVVVSGVARFYISIIRGTPLLVQLFIVFFALPQIGVRIDPFPAATRPRSSARRSRASRRDSGRPPRPSGSRTSARCGGSSCRKRPGWRCPHCRTR